MMREGGRGGTGTEPEKDGMTDKTNSLVQGKGRGGGGKGEGERGKRHGHGARKGMA